MISPNVNDMTLFQSGRLKIIPFNRHFEEGEQDQGLKGQFAKPENLSGIFNWCLEGYKKFCQAVFVGAYLWARAKAACFVIHEREDRT